MSDMGTGVFYSCSHVEDCVANVGSEDDSGLWGVMSDVTTRVCSNLCANVDDCVPDVASVDGSGLC